MYQIKLGNDTLHDSRSNNVRLVDPKCDMELNKTGTLKFRIQPTHPFFDAVKQHKSELSLYQDGEWLFTGRVLNDETDIFGYKTVEVEGMLGYMLDSIQSAKEYNIRGERKIERYLTDVLTRHNEQIDDFKKIFVGNIMLDASGELKKISEYKDTLTTINNELIAPFGGYFFPRVTNGVKYLDYLRVDDFPINNQIIRLGKNILSLKKNVRGEDIATVIIPLGKKKETENDVATYHGLSELPYTKDGSIVHPQGTNFIYDEVAVEKYGHIVKVVEHSDIEDASELLAIAKEQLKLYRTENMSLELSVFDLHLLNVNFQSIRVGQKIRVISKRHDLDLFMIVQKISLNLDQPDKSQITLVTEEKSPVTTNSGSISNKTSVTDKNVIAIQQDLNSGLGGFGGDMSQYATVAEVNLAFNELGTLIGGM